MKVLQSYSEFA